MRRMRSPGGGGPPGLLACAVERTCTLYDALWDKRFRVRAARRALGAWGWGKVGLTEKGRSMAVVQESLLLRRPVPAYLSLDEAAMAGRLERLPLREEIPVEADESLVVELYAR